MNNLLKFTGGAVVAALLAYLLSVFVFGMSSADGLNTALLAAAVALVILVLNDYQTDGAAE